MKAQIGGPFLLWVSAVAALCWSCGSGGSSTGSDGLTWQSPEALAEVFGLVPLKVKSNARPAPASVRFYDGAVDPSKLLGTAEVKGDDTFSLSFRSREVPNGEHTLLAAADEGAGIALTITVANRTRGESIPPTAVKQTPATDAHPPALEPAFRTLFEDPIPLGDPINTAGAEDSPFITADGQELYFFFTPDLAVPAERQLQDRVTGIYRSRRQGSGWGEPVRVDLSYFPELALDGCPTVQGDTLWFCSARANGFRGVDMLSATEVDGDWTGWSNAGKLLNQDYELGELHVADGGLTIYFDSTRAGGKGLKDIWVVRRSGDSWLAPENVDALNTAQSEGWPFVSEDGSELWFTRLTPAPEIFRSRKQNGVWQPPERVLSSLAGEPTLDAEGNLTFVHHYFRDADQKLLESDLYFCRRR
jgi:hypothetical protein